MLWQVDQALGPVLDDDDLAVARNLHDRAVVTDAQAEDAISKVEMLGASDTEVDQSVPYRNPLPRRGKRQPPGRGGPILIEDRLVRKVDQANGLSAPIAAVMNHQRRARAPEVVEISREIDRGCRLVGMLGIDEMELVECGLFRGDWP